MIALSLLSLLLLATVAQAAPTATKPTTRDTSEDYPIHGASNVPASAMTLPGSFTSNSSSPNVQVQVVVVVVGTQKYTCNSNGTYEWVPLDCILKYNWWDVNPVALLVPMLKFLTCLACMARQHSTPLRILYTTNGTHPPWTPTRPCIGKKCNLRMSLYMAISLPLNKMAFLSLSGTSRLRGRMGLSRMPPSMGRWWTVFLRPMPLITSIGWSTTRQLRGQTRSTVLTQWEASRRLL